MNSKVENELARLSAEIQAASRDLALMANEYESRRQSIQTALTSASGQLSTLVSMISKGQVSANGQPPQTKENYDSKSNRENDR